MIIKLLEEDTFFLEVQPGNWLWDLGIFHKCPKLEGPGRLIMGHDSSESCWHCGRSITSKMEAMYHIARMAVR